MVFGGVHFLPDGRRAVSGAGDIFAAAKDNTVRVWDLETGQELRRFEGHTDNRRERRWSLRGLRLPRRHPAPVEYRERRGPSPARRLSPSRAQRGLQPRQGIGLAKGQASNPDYRRGLLDTETGREIHRLVGHREVVADVALSPDGKRILSSSTDSNVILWDATNGAEIHQLVVFALLAFALVEGSQVRVVETGDSGG